ncbi:gamma carbonic anhydrase family protein [Mitsuokella sp.]|uniref:gamma carbonic anhydrase family protein n=1 Tax=Mitsuokella sp. TaxID=2049034 RepID=UPI003D7EB455
MYTLSSTSYQGHTPKIDDEAFLAPGAVVLGDVEVAKYASIWPAAVVRGDVGFIRIGAYSNVQDTACLHVEDNGPCIIGRFVTIGHGAIVHACTVEDNVLIGMNATVLSGAKIGSGSIIAAGALVKENAVIPPNSLVTGIPGKVKKTIDRAAAIHAQAVKYKTLWSVGYGLAPEIGGETYHGEKII